MRILIAYGTTEGHTEAIARFIDKRFLTHGLDASLVPLATSEPMPDPAHYTLVIIAASLHGGRYQPDVVAFCSRHHETLNAMPSVFFSVSLSAMSDEKDDRDLLAKLNAGFFEETAWKPKAIHEIAGALRFSKYDFLKDWVMKYIAWKRGIPRKGDEDEVFTDWEALGKIVDDLVASEVRVA